jgi:hypothetical protein
LAPRDYIPQLQEILIELNLVCSSGCLAEDLILGCSDGVLPGLGSSLVLGFGVGLLLSLIVGLPGDFGWLPGLAGVFI